MCKITSMELYGTELDMPVVRDFELWFQTAFGVSDREAWWGARPLRESSQCRT
jgi:hypothetical protein